MSHPVPQNETCQLFHYKNDEIEIVKNSIDYFTTHFQVDKLDTDHVHWLNFHSISDRPKIEKFCSHQQFELLTVNDIFIKKNRPKLEEYKNYFFFSIYSALPTNSQSSRLNQEKISFVLGDNYLISFQERSSDHFADVRDRIEQKKGLVRDKGADFLLYRMLDAIVDNYFEVLEDISEVIDNLEGVILRSSSHAVLSKIEFQKRKLQELRKIVMPLKEIAISLESTNSTLISAENHHFFIDLKQNCLSILDEIDSNKLVLESMANLFYAAQGQRMNEIMKVLTIVSVIFIPLTFIVGVYGMNFDYMPELRAKNGYFIIWGVMVSLSVLMLLFFIKKGWLKRK